MNEGAIIISPADSPVPASFQSWGIEIIERIQSAGNPALTVLMKAISALGAEFFYIPVVMFFFWCWSEKKGFRLGLLILISAWINSVLKVLFDQPRPFDFNPALGLAFESSNGFPSAHAQVSASFWLAAAFYTRRYFGKGNKFRALAWICGILLILLIGYSRLYLGVHFPTDLLGGWVTALIILGAFYGLEKPVSTLLIKGGQRPQLIITALAVLLMNALHPADTSLSAMFLGFSAGYGLMLNRFPFDAREGRPGLLRQSFRFLLGIIGAVIIYFGLKLVIPGQGSVFEEIPGLEPYYELGRFVRYGFLGLWASAGAPRVFQNLGLARAPAPSDSPERK